MRRFVISAMVVLLAAACSSGPADRPSPAATSDSSSAGAEATAQSDPLEGTWETGPLSQEDFVRAWEAAGGSEREGRGVFARLGNGATTSAVITMRFQDGFFVEFQTGDDGVASHSSDATYELFGDGSLRMMDPGAPTDCVGTFTYRVQGDRLTLQVVKRCGQRTRPFGETLFASFPFTRVS